MRHRGTKKGRPAIAGYDWYDRKTGAIDIALLATEATFGDRSYVDAPAWAKALPTEAPGASAVELARIDAQARNAYLDSFQGV